MKNLMKILLLASVVLCPMCSVFAQQSDTPQQIPIFVPVVKAETIWYVYDDDGDGVSDVLTKNESKAAAFAKRTGRSLTMVKVKSGKDIQVYITITDDAEIITIENPGTVHGSEGRVLLPE